MLLPPPLLCVLIPSTGLEYCSRETFRSTVPGSLGPRKTLRLRRFQGRGSSFVRKRRHRKRGNDKKQIPDSWVIRSSANPQDSRTNRCTCSAMLDVLKLDTLLFVTRNNSYLSAIDLRGIINFTHFIDLYNLIVYSPRSAAFGPGAKMGYHPRRACASTQAICYIQNQDMGDAQLATRRRQQRGSHCLCNLVETRTEREIRQQAYGKLLVSVVAKA